MCDCNNKYLLITLAWSHYHKEPTLTICINPDDVTYRLNKLKKDNHYFIACYKITGEKLVQGSHWVKEYV